MAGTLLPRPHSVRNTLTLYSLLYRHYAFYTKWSPWNTWTFRSL